MPEEKAPPIEVKESATYASVETTIGQLIPAVGGIIVALGLVTSEKWAVLVGPLTIIAGVVWRIWRTRRTHAKLVTLVTEVPDRIARFK